jgi:hypothetical protein
VSGCSEGRGHACAVARAPVGMPTRHRRQKRMVKAAPTPHRGKDRRRGATQVRCMTAQFCVGRLSWGADPSNDRTSRIGGTE